MASTGNSNNLYFFSENIDVKGEDDNCTTGHPSKLDTDSCLQLAHRVLLKEIEKGSNFVVSPLSLHLSLVLVAAGSTGKTLEQILFFLGSESVDHLKLSSSEIISLISCVEKPILSFVHGAWVDRQFGLKPSYEEVVKQVFRGQVEEVDFVNKAKEVAEEVNSWVENNTNGLIKDITPLESVDHKTALVIANALYLKGSWDQSFDVSGTKSRNFYLLNGQIVQVPFMTSHFIANEFFYRSYNDHKVLRLPYQNGHHSMQKFCMYFFLPHDRSGLPDLIHSIASKPAFLNQNFVLFKEEIPNFWIPRFKFSFKFEASKELIEMGLDLPFDSKNGELTELSFSPRSPELYVSDIFHKACIEVNEEGTEAAASTVAVCQLQCLKTNFATFVADHPFLFMIREETSKTVFFVGAVLDPSLVS